MDTSKTKSEPDALEPGLLLESEPPPAPIFPRLDDVVQPDDVAKKGGGSFQAEYVNWSRIAHYLREHAPGWQPFMERDENGRPFHYAPDGSVYLLIGFRHPDPAIPATEVVVHAVMDAKNSAFSGSEVDARDISDAYVRGMCKAAALLFGLGWKLWSKDDPMTRDTSDQHAGGGRSTPNPKGNTTPRQHPKDNPADNVGKPLVGSITDPQRKAIYAKTKAIGMDDEDRAALLDKYGVTASTELSRSQASEILDMLVEREKTS